MKKNNINRKSFAPHKPRSIENRIAKGDDIYLKEELENNKIKLTPYPEAVISRGTVIDKDYLQPIEDFLGELRDEEGHLIDSRGKVAIQTDMDSQHIKSENFQSRINDLEEKTSSTDEKVISEVKRLEYLIDALPRMKKEIVDSLPTTNVSTTTLYLLREESVFTMFVNIDGVWQSLGSTNVDLEGVVMQDGDANLNSIIVSNLSTFSGGFNATGGNWSQVGIQGGTLDGTVTGNANLQVNSVSVNSLTTGTLNVNALNINGNLSASNFAIEPFHIYRALGARTTFDESFTVPHGINLLNLVLTDRGQFTSASTTYFLPNITNRDGERILEIRRAQTSNSSNNRRRVRVSATFNHATRVFRIIAHGNPIEQTSWTAARNDGTRGTELTLTGF